MSINLLDRIFIIHSKLLGGSCLFILSSDADVFLETLFALHNQVDVNDVENLVEVGST